MRQLFWMGGPTWTDGKNIPRDARQLTAYVWAENDDEAIEKARLLGIDADFGEYTKCDEAGRPEQIPERLIGHVLSEAEFAELGRIRKWPGHPATPAD